MILIIIFGIVSIVAGCFMIYDLGRSLPIINLSDGIIRVIQLVCGVALMILGLYALTHPETFMWGD